MALRTNEDLAKLSPRDQELRLFMEEMGATPNLVSHSGRAQIGPRAFGPKPSSRGPRIKILGALSSAGLETTRGFAGTLTRAGFRVCLTPFRLPVWKPGQTLILDHASPPGQTEVTTWFGKAGVSVIDLPPDSPPLNPSEGCWSKVKNFLKRAPARTKETLSQALPEALTQITQEDSEAWFRHGL